MLSEEQKSDMMKETKAQLVTRIEELMERVGALERHASAVNSILSESGEPGYLFTTKNPNFNQTVFGVRFEMGRAFVPASHQRVKEILQVLKYDLGYNAQEMTAKEYKQLVEAAPRAAEVEEEKSFLEKVSQPQAIGRSK